MKIKDYKIVAKEPEATVTLGTISSERLGRVGDRTVFRIKEPLTREQADAMEAEVKRLWPNEKKRPAVFVGSAEVVELVPVYEDDDQAGKPVLIDEPYHSWCMSPAGCAMPLGVMACAIVAVVMLCLR